MIGKFVDFLSCTRNLSLDVDALAALQTQKLQRVIRHAYMNVPYYRRLLDAAGVTPDDIRTPADLGQIPMSSKDDLLNAGNDELIAANVERSRLVSSLTSGSTGKAFTVVRTPRDVQRRKLFDLRALISVGFRPLDKLAAYTVRRAASGKNPQQLFYRSRWFSAMEPIETSIAGLTAYDPSFLWSYPSSFRSLHDFTTARGSFPCRPRTLVTTAEAPDATLRDDCEALGLEHYNFYGAVETGRIGWECAAHDGLHLNTDNVVLEIVPTNDAHGSESAGLGEAVITTLNNEAMPFVRYRLGDLCSFIDRPCSCGSPLPLISAPVGRTSDLVELPSGRLLSARGLAALIRRQGGIRQLLITQTDRQHVEVQVIVDNGITDSAAVGICSKLREHLAEPVDVAVRVVDSIEQPGPKARDFISLIR